MSSRDIEIFPRKMRITSHDRRKLTFVYGIIIVALVFLDYLESKEYLTGEANTTIAGQKKSAAYIKPCNAFKYMGGAMNHRRRQQGNLWNAVLPPESVR